MVILFFCPQSLEFLGDLYESVWDVDLLVGILLEEKKGNLAGPVASFIMEEQFYRSKFGNRFHYALADNPNPFTAGEYIITLLFLEVLKTMLFGL